MNPKWAELFDVLKRLDWNALGVLIRFARCALESRDPHAFLLDALNDKLEKERGRPLETVVTVIESKGTKG